MKLPQLYLRDLFWLILVIGMGLGWWTTYRTLRYQVWYSDRLSECYWAELEDLGYKTEVFGEGIRVSVPKYLQERPEGPGSDSTHVVTGFSWDPARKLKSGASTDPKWVPPPKK